MTKINERTSTRETQQKSPLTGPPPAGPPKDPAVDDDVEDIGGLAGTDAAQLERGASRGPLFADARSTRSPPAVKERDGPVFDDDLEGLGNVDDGPGYTVVSGDATQVGKTPGPRAAASTFKSVDAGIAAIEKKFGVTVVPDNWTPEELSRVHESLEKTGPKERQALRGIELRREGTAPPEVLATEPGGDVAGFFFANTAPGRDGTRQSPPAIVWYDAAFPTSAHSGVDRRTSMQVVLHEVGHAADARAGTDVVAAKNEAAQQVKNGQAAQGANEPAYNLALAAFNGALVGQKNQPQLNRVRDTLVGFSAAVKQVKAAKTDAQLQTALKGLERVTKARDAAIEKLGVDHPLKGAIDDLAAAEDAIAPDVVATATADVKFRALAKSEAQAFAVVDNPKTSADESVTRGVAAFERALAAGEAVSEYGATNQKENLAEAYALYRRDPSWLKEQHPKAFAWMKAKYP